MEKTILQNQLWRSSPAHYKGVGVLILFLLLSPMLYAQSLMVKGKVSDGENNQTMPGVTVTVKGTTNGTTTDAEGNYSLFIPDGVNNPTLVFSFIGYATQEQTLSGRTVVDVQLVSDIKELSEVVVVGYGTQLKRDITGAILKVDQDVLLQTASPNAYDQLKGHAAGVDIVSASSVPGGGSQIRIRGNRTMVANSASNANSVSATSASNDAVSANNADQPLLVVDGIPYTGDLNDISPNDIASLEILKDASATAIYGSRGAGGVILVTTKRGQSGKPQFSYDGYYGVGTVMKELPVFNGKEYAQFKQDAGNGYPLTPTEQTNLSKGVSTDWQKLLYRNAAPIQNHALSVSGGNDKSKYSLSGVYFKQDGIIPNQDFTRYNVRSTMDHQINKRIRIGLNTINTLSVQNIPGGAGVPQTLMRLSPLISPYNADGTLNTNNGLPSSTGVQPTTDQIIFNPLTLKTNSAAILNRARRLRTFNSFYGEIDIVKGLKYRGNVGLDYSQEKDDSYLGPSVLGSQSTNQSSSQASVNNTQSWQYTVENLLLYDRTFNEKHKIGFTGLYSFQKSHADNTYLAAVGVPFDYMQNTNFYPAQTVNVGNSLSSQSWDRGIVSFMARATYSYDGRYSFTATWRRDGSSVLSAGHKYYSYPAFAAAWNISNEKFMSSVPVLSTLKLRAGYGVTANQNISPYATLGALSTSAYNFGQGSGGNNVVGINVTSLPNPALKWQSTQQWNAGLDFGILENRITGAVEVYHQYTSNILLPINLPISNGASSAYINAGKTEDHGVELSLNSVNVKSSSGFTWSTEYNYFFNREKITALAYGQTENIGNGWFVGQPVSVIYDYKKIGIWQTGDPGLTSQTLPSQVAGQIKVQDWNTANATPGTANYGKPDGKITPDDRQILGNFQPKFDMGMTNRFAYKNFDFSFSMYARIGMKVVVPYLATEPGGANYTGFNFFNSGRSNQLKVDYWTPTHATNAFPQPTSAGTPYFGSSMQYVDGSFVKLRTVNLGYTVPSEALKRIGVTQLRVYVSAVNPWVIWSPFVKDGYGPDPEGNGYGGAVSSSGTSGQQAVHGGIITVNANNPSTRQFLVGLNLKF